MNIRHRKHQGSYTADRAAPSKRDATKADYYFGLLHGAALAVLILAVIFRW